MGFRLRDTAALPWSSPAGMGLMLSFARVHQTPNNRPGICSHCAGKGSSPGQGWMELWGIEGKCFSREGGVWAGQGDRGRTGCSESGQVHSLICDGLNPHLAQNMGLTWESCSNAGDRQVLQQTSPR